MRDRTPYALMLFAALLMPLVYVYTDYQFSFVLYLAAVIFTGFIAYKIYDHFSPSRDERRFPSE